MQGYLILGTCPLGGLIIMDGFVHLGTFCNDRTATLPVGHELYIWNEELIIILYRYVIFSLIFAARTSTPFFQSMETHHNINAAKVSLEIEHRVDVQQSDSNTNTHQEIQILVLQNILIEIQ